MKSAKRGGNFEREKAGAQKFFNWSHGVLDELVLDAVDSRTEDSKKCWTKLLEFDIIVTGSLAYTKNSVDASKNRTKSVR